VKILIVDDEPAVASLIADSVKMQGHDPIVTSNSEEVMGLLDREKPDAVFLDIVMPRLNGIEVLRQIRQRSKTLPVIVITGHASREQTEEARRLGVTDLIKKPYVLNQVDEALGHLEADKGSA
jgi:DNA-binding response OmpR family regulator